MSILLVTHSLDIAVPEVEQALRERGGVPLRLDTDLYPLQVQLTTTYRGSECGGWLVTPSGRFTLSDVTAIWYRRFAAGRELPLELGDARNACVQEARKTLYGMIVSLPVFQVDPVRRVQHAEHKELQLKLASSIGLSIPKTIFTNDAVVVRQFYDELGGEMICKMQSGVGVDGHFVYTSKMTLADLKDLKDLRYSPMTFQEAVPKKLELRATVVGRRVFTAAVDSQQVEKSSVDWRRDPQAMTDAWEHYALPADVEAGLLRLTEMLGLNYGAADFILTPEGRYVFLEINAGGEWMWLARKPGLPIASALADLLLGRVERLTQSALPF